ncbi:MAG: hypothetical protein GWO07_00915 [Candidatus Dadabacteria bacterium]|nr:hypothetical protein [Candidatus Dadabacteria bacterium]NIS07338.1 hypothetical protein [Candidatus Dadabacteria bacterium]NIV41282.1 hypothetical protein [Candidatus Dadabacteria bacterium]NIX14517.1 hypothetical protein [Candidatus Dadabacteria bacterium]NIY20975.1 hypothetical protein [Candidatus Dadabacteria bacterium]
MKSQSLLTYLLFVIAFLTTASVYAVDDAFKDSALSWQKQATGTRAAVISVYEELTKIGDKGNADAKELIDDAVTQLGEGDKQLKAGDELFAKNEFEKASYDYNMAWQYYVKAATAGLNAKRILTGQ